MDLLWIIFGALFVFVKLLGEGANKRQSVVDSAISDEFRRKWYAHPLLEAWCRNECAKPSKYNEIWECIEKYKEDNGATMRLTMSALPRLWEEVGKRRFVIFDNKGKIPRDTICEDNYMRFARLYTCTFNRLPYAWTSKVPIWKGEKALLGEIVDTSDTQMPDIDYSQFTLGWPWGSP